LHEQKRVTNPLQVANLPHIRHYTASNIGAVRNLRSACCSMARTKWRRMS
jgi:hypothetical protein